MRKEKREQNQSLGEVEPIETAKPDLQSQPFQGIA
jgi:hypothetical protein